MNPIAEIVARYRDAESKGKLSNPLWCVEYGLEKEAQTILVEIEGEQHPVTVQALEDTPGVGDELAREILKAIHK